MSLSPDTTEPLTAPNRVALDRLGGIPWLLPAIAIFAIVCLLAAVGLGAAMAARSSGSSGFTSTVIPARTDTQASTAGVDTARSVQASGAASAISGAPASVSPGAGSSAPLPIIYGGSCAAAPTVQFQGRGLAVTGVAPITPSAPATISLSVNVQERGGDATTVISNTESKVQMIVNAMQQAGVPGSSIQQTSFSSFGSFQGQFTAYASIQAQVVGNDQLTQVTKAVLQVGGVYGYSSSSSLAVQPTAAEVQAAVSAATAQARDTADATARAAGVLLGSVQSVAAQPPAVCYGPAGPMRVTQVTLNYAIK